MTEFSEVPDRECDIWWTVDEAIECLPITDDLRQRLMTVAPRAYHEPVMLYRIVAQLAPADVAALNAAGRAEGRTYDVTAGP